MKLYTFPPAPNPRRVTIFMAEKDIEIPTVNVDLLKGEQFSAEFRAKSPLCDVPVLELDNGTCISQVNAICRYLEAVYPHNPLYGDTPEQVGLIEMWNHICFFNGLHSVAEVYRNGEQWPEGRALIGHHSYNKLPQLVERGIQRVNNFFSDLDERLAGNQYIAGEQFSIADITALAAVDFAKWVKLRVPESHGNLRRWYALVNERPSVQASLPKRD